MPSFCLLPFLRSGTVIAVAGLLLIPAPSRAQHPTPGAPPAADTQAVAEEPESGDRKLPLESVAPYTAWKHHVAERPEQAVVQVRFAPAGGGPKSTTTGLVIRCDGFVMVPRGVRDTVRRGGVAEVILPDADGAPVNEGNGKKRKAPVIAATRHHPFTHASVPYALIKMTGQHTRSLPLLDSVNVVSGKAVRLLWFTLDGDGTAATPLSRKAIIGARTEVTDTFALALSEPGDAGGQTVPVGAVVLDDESGAAIGMISQAGTSPVFTTLARLHVISDEVGLAPDRTSVRLGDRPGTLPQGTPDMVWVPGGPVELDGIIAKAWVRDYGTTVACTPGVWVAVQPVTNGEYRRWLAGQTWRHLPNGWAPADLEKPLRREDLPACGMFGEDASLYAASRRSRLPTEVEWRRAAFTRDTEWVEEKNRQWAEASSKVRGLLLSHFRLYTVAYNSAVTAARYNTARSGGQNAIRSNARVNIIVPSTPEIDAVAAELSQYSDSFMNPQEIWGQVMSIDLYRQDVSVFGVRNVLINAPEMVESRVQSATYAPKKFPARVDPHLTQFTWSFNQGGTEADANTANDVRRMLFAWLSIINWHGGNGNIIHQGAFLSLARSTTESASYSLSINAQAAIRTRVYAGFRCAR
ncbi:MAG: SUMF1/EgtB/PvdO family nonheme iron enzyme [Armatimonadota bacterium]